MGAGQAMKRIPLIKFPQRHHKPSISGSKQQSISANENAAGKDDDILKLISRPQTMSLGGRASDQPKRTPVSQEEIEAIMLGGCI